MADIRNDGREKKMFDLKANWKRSRRRNTHAPGSKLFIGGLSYEDTEELKGLMTKLGSVEDCVVSMMKMVNQEDLDSLLSPPKKRLKRLSQSMMVTGLRVEEFL